MAEAIAFFAPEHRPAIGAAFAACIRDGAPYDLELDIITPKGRRVPVHTMGRAEHDSSGAVARVKGALQDLTLFRQAEQEAIGRNQA
jgi:hypothetical protein